MNFSQIREYTTGLIKKAFPNKKVLNKIGEEDGTLTYDGSEIKGSGSSPLTEEEMHEIKNQLLTYSSPTFPAEQYKYSLNEQLVGEWVDGNPIYEKTYHIEFTGNTGFSMNGEHLVSNSENDQEYDCWWNAGSSSISFYVKVKPDNIGDIMIVKDVAFIFFKNGQKSMISPFNNSSNIVQFQRGFQVSDEPIIYINTLWSSNYYWTDAYVTVQYTK